MVPDPMRSAEMVANPPPMLMVPSLFNVAGAWPVPFTCNREEL